MRDARLAVERTGDLAVDRRRGVRVIAEVHREEAAFGERVAAGEGPQCGLEAAHHVATSLDLRRIAAQVGTTRDLFDLRVQVPERPEVGIEQLLLARACHGPGQHDREQAARIRRLRRSVRRNRAACAELRRERLVAACEERGGSEAHERTVPGGLIVGVDELTRGFEASQGRARRAADVEAAAVRRQVASRHQRTYRVS